VRAVFDTNVFVAAVLRLKGPTARLLELWRKRRFCLVFTEETIAEALAVLKELGVGRVHQQRLESLIRSKDRRRSVIVVPRQRLNVIHDEPDNHFLEAAVAGRAEYLVTNNKRHFQDAGVVEFRGVRVVTISEFVDLMGALSKS
jgi:putative PIN family toxin of toxin-antitoxin system